MCSNFKLLQGLTDEQKAKVQAISKECREKSGVKEELILKARKGEFIDDPKLKEHLLCFSKKIGFQNEAGELQPEVIKAKIGADIPAADFQKAAEKCNSLKRTAPEQTAFDVLKCYSEASGAKISFS